MDSVSNQTTSGAKYFPRPTMPSWSLPTQFWVFVDYNTYQATHIAVVTDQMKKLKMCSSTKHGATENCAREAFSSSPFHFEEMLDRSAFVAPFLKGDQKLFAVTVCCKGTDGGGCMSRKPGTVRVVVRLSGENGDNLTLVSELIQLQARGTKEEKTTTIEFSNLVVPACDYNCIKLFENTINLVPTFIVNVDEDILEDDCCRIPLTKTEKKIPGSYRKREAAVKRQKTQQQQHETMSIQNQLLPRQNWEQSHQQNLHARQQLEQYMVPLETQHEQQPQQLIYPEHDATQQQLNSSLTEEQILYLLCHQKLLHRQQQEQLHMQQEQYLAQLQYQQQQQTFLLEQQLLQHQVYLLWQTYQLLQQQQQQQPPQQVRASFDFGYGINENDRGETVQQPLQSGFALSHFSTPLTGNTHQSFNISESANTLIDPVIFSVPNLESHDVSRSDLTSISPQCLWYDDREGSVVGSEVVMATVVPPVGDNQGAKRNNKTFKRTRNAERKAPTPYIQNPTPDPSLGAAFPSKSTSDSLTITRTLSSTSIISTPTEAATAVVMEQTSPRRRIVLEVSERETI